MSGESKNHAIAKLAKVMKVSRSGYYAWLQEKENDSKANRDVVKLRILKIYIDSKKIYGAPKITEILRKEGFSTAQRTVSKYMKELGIRSIVARKFRPQTKKRADIGYENRLNQEFKTDSPNKVWVTDITYIWTRKDKWVYLASVMDLYSRKIVGYEVSKKMDTNLIKKALANAVAERGNPEEIIHHSDRGSQYTSASYLDMLKMFKFKISLSGKGNCYDNACIEAYHSILKKEYIYTRSFEKLEDLKLGLFQYIESFYNFRRIHGTLGYISPVEFEEAYFKAEDSVA